MSLLFSQIIPSLLTLKIIGNTDLFIKCLEKKYPNKPSEELFAGYQFAINCCLNAFIDGVTNDNVLGVKSDFIFERANLNYVPIHQIESSCEKTIFLKNLKPYISQIKQAKSFDALNNKIKAFENNITSKFDLLLDKNIYINKKIKIDKQTAIKLLLIDFAQTYLVQINNNGPTANFINPISVKWLQDEDKKCYFEGYKFTIQYLWNTLLGDIDFNKTSLVNIYKADSWNDYKYIENNEANELAFFDRHFNIDEQTSLDSYFYRIKNEIIDKLNRIYNFEIYTVESYFLFNAKAYKKKNLFSDLLNKEDNKKYKPNFNKALGEELSYAFLWYPIEIVDSKKVQSHFGISSFNVMLAGLVALHNPKESEFSKILVIKFTHPIKSECKKNDYSYGVLVDTKSAAGHSSSGWVIYQNVCGDYSGSSGSEYCSVEKLLKKYKKEKQVDIKEIIIPLRKFQEYTAKYILSENQINIKAQNDVVDDIIRKARAHLFELFTYYILNNNEKYYSKYKIRLNDDANNSEGEKDVVLISNDESEVIIVECKLTPENQNYKELFRKIKEKLNSSKYENKKKSVQLWFWNEPTTRNINDIDKFKENIDLKIVCLTKHDKKSILNGVNISQLKHIMQNYEK